MNRHAYLFVLIFITAFLGVSLASVQTNNPGTDDKTRSSNNKSEIIHAPVVTKSVTEQISGRGQLLYENHCTACHEKSVHSRKHYKANSINDIHQWVIRWSNNLELGWGKHDVDVVTDFLNRRYYHFTIEK